MLLLRLAILLLAHRRCYVAIHAHIANTMAAVCCVVGRLIGRSVVVKFAGSWEMDHGILDPRMDGAVTRSLRWPLRQATFYHATSSRIVGLLPRCGFERARVHQIPNAVDTERYQPGTDNGELRRDLGIETRLVGVFVGRLAREKALAFFFEGWARVFRQSDSAALLVVGDGVSSWKA